MLFSLFVQFIKQHLFLPPALSLMVVIHCSQMTNIHAQRECALELNLAWYLQDCVFTSMGENSLPTKGLTNLLIWKLLGPGCSKQDLKGSALPSLASCSETLRNRLYLAEVKNPKVKFIFWASWFAPNSTLHASLLEITHWQQRKVIL